MMKTYKYLAVLLLPALASCGSDDVQYHIETPEDQMFISASAEELVLEAADAEKEVLTFSWNAPADRGAGSEITSYFRMDIADNNFASATELMEIQPGQTSVSFTADELNDYLLGWGISPETMVRIEAEIVASVDNEAIYMKPEVSTTTVLLTGYRAVARPLYIVNAAMDEGTDVQMNEPVLSKQYNWSGWFDKNTGVKFVYDIDGQGTAITKGSDNNTLVKTEGDTGELFMVEESGYYTVHLNLKNMTCTWELLEPVYENLWMVGDAVPCGWNIDDPTPMSKSEDTPWVFVYTGYLGQGEIKMPLAVGAGWGCDYLMPLIHYSDQDGDDNVKFVQGGNPDDKWNITREGNYRVEVNTFTMKIKFAQLDN